MIGTTRPLRGKKLLVAAVGVGTLTFAACAAFPGCNLAAPVPCPGTGTFDCYERQDLRQPADANTDAAPTDGSLDGLSK